MAKATMLEHEPYGAVHLNESGRQRALTIYRRHENVSFIFSETFGFKRELANNVACMMEHELDETGEQKVFALAEFICRNRRKSAKWTKELEDELKKIYSSETPRNDGKNKLSEIVRLSRRPPLRLKLLEMGLCPELM